MVRSYKLNHLDHLEAESIFIIREVAAQFEKPVLLFSGGKDSLVIAHLAKKAFWPGNIPFPFMHVDTGHNFQETLGFRDGLIKDLGVELIIASVQRSIDMGRVTEETGPYASRNKLQTTTLLDALEEYKFDVAFGGARRDEEKARAKERIFSHRDAFGQWDPKNQRPELWNLYNGMRQIGEHFRVFPLSNWTEIDIWHYIASRNIKIPSLYYAHSREVFLRDEVYLAKSECIENLDHEVIEEKIVRFRTIGDMTCTGATISTASTIEEIIAEVAASRVTERGGRADDKRSEMAMEARKKEGYF